jgi:hypothetical protein
VCFQIISGEVRNYYGIFYHFCTLPETLVKRASALGRTFGVPGQDVLLVTIIISRDNFKYFWLTHNTFCVHDVRNMEYKITSSFECLAIQFGECECKLYYVWACDIVRILYFIWITGLWDVTLWSLVVKYKWLGGISCTHFQDRKFVLSALKTRTSGSFGMWLCTYQATKHLIPQASKSISRCWQNPIILQAYPWLSDQSVLTFTAELRTQINSFTTRAMSNYKLLTQFGIFNL